MPTISEHDALPPGARLAEFEIQQILGIGGFGIVYLAFDHALERQVAIKEYMPAALASRGFGSEIVVRSAAHVDTFALGMRSFINEARLLARFDHPSLVKVYRFWEQHGTAYMVMPYYKGRTLQEVRRNMDGPPDEAWLRRLITPLLGALERLHRENVFHRDVAPDNILLLDDESGPGRGPPVLLDLGAARRVIGDHTQTLTAIVKPSFAPIEQYAETVQLRQGPWTDLYALAAVVHFCITGRPPLPATVRTVHDDVATLRQMSASLASGFDRHFSESFVHAIDHAMAVRPQDRPDSVSALRSELDGVIANPAHAGTPPTDSKSEAWMAQAVVVRADPREHANAPLKAFAGEEAFMQTVPAAGRLSAPPAWPAQRAEASVSSGAPVSLAMSPPVSSPPMSPLMATQEGRAMPLHAPMGHVPQTIPETVPIARPAKVEVPELQAVGAPAASLLASSPSSPLQPVSSSWPSSPSPSSDWQAELRTQPRTQPNIQANVEANGEGNRSPQPVAATPAGIIAARGGSSPWLRWTSAALLLSLGIGVWLSQPGVKREAIANEAVAKASPTGAGPLASVGGSNDATEAMDGDAGKPAQVVSRPEARPDGVRKPDASRSELGRSAASGPLNPRRACGDRTFIWLAICMKRHCSRSDYRGHSECVRMRQQEEAQRSTHDYP